MDFLPVCPRPGWDKDQFSRHIFSQDKSHKYYSDGRFFDITTDPNEKNPIPEPQLTQVQKAAREKLSNAIELTMLPSGDG